MFISLKVKWFDAEGRRSKLCFSKEKKTSARGKGRGASRAGQGGLLVARAIPSTEVRSPAQTDPAVLS